MLYRKGDSPVPGYHLEKFLGRGNFGEVWRALAPGGTRCAMKFIILSELQGSTNSQGWRELKAITHVKHIRHPNLVEMQAIWLKDSEGILHDTFDSIVGHHQGDLELILIMGLGERSLWDRLNECREIHKLPGIPREELQKYMFAAAEGIDYLNEERHDLGEGKRVSIQHRDIKPHNILIVGGSAQICDFGLAKVLANDTRLMSQSTSNVGTPAYASPEAMGSLSEALTSRTGDQYSLAISYYEMRRGRLPFEKETCLSDVLVDKAAGRLVWPDLTSREQDVLKRATDLNPEKRYRSTSDFVNELADASRSSSGNRGQVGGQNRPISNLHQLQQVGSEIVPYITLEEPLGEGSYGKVWKARKKSGLTKSVAVKIVNLVDGSGFRELRALHLLSDLDHPNLIRVDEVHALDATGQIIDLDKGLNDASQAPQLLVIVMELAQLNLSKLLANREREGQGAIPIEDLVRYVEQTAAAIDYLNAKGIQHRDIKPENIMLGRSGTVKVADFGLAKLVQNGVLAIQPGSQGFTAFYASPEVLNGQLTPQTDQYSLAVTYYHLRTGRLPFAREHRSLAEILRDHLDGRLQFDDLRNNPGEIKALRRATSLNAENRFPTCQAFVEELKRGIASGGAEPEQAGFATIRPDFSPSQSKKTNPWPPVMSPDYEPPTKPRVTNLPPPTTPKPSPPPKSRLLQSAILLLASVAVGASIYFLVKFNQPSSGKGTMTEQPSGPPELLPYPTEWSNENGANAELPTGSRKRAPAKPVEPDPDS